MGDVDEHDIAADPPSDHETPGGNPVNEVQEEPNNQAAAPVPEPEEKAEDSDS